MKTCKTCKYRRKTVSAEGITKCFACVAHIDQIDGAVMLITINGTCPNYEVKNDNK